MAMQHFGVADRAGGGRHLCPSVFVPFEPIFKETFVRRGKVEAGKVNLKTFGAGRNRYGMERRRAQRIGSLQTAIQTHGLNDYGRRIGVANEQSWIH